MESQVSTPSLKGSLSDQAANLAKELQLLKETCGHESTSVDISGIAKELVLLCAELRSLDEAVVANVEHFTDAFNQDLAEIKAHLQGIFEDISDCCTEMHKADGINGTAVGWLCKKRYVRKLQKHLEANKTTVIVMRTVLAHSRSYVAYRLAEAAPHTMYEDRAILEAIFASRNAITDLRKYGDSHRNSSSNTSSAASESIQLEPGPHGCRLSSSTGFDTLQTDDVLPAGGTSAQGKQREDAIGRRFSRRGVRLAVHSSIMNSTAGETPDSLGRRWIQVRTRKSLEFADRNLPSVSQLSKISEADSTSFHEMAAVALDKSQSRSTIDQGRVSGSDCESKEATPEGSISKAKRHGHFIMDTSIGRTLTRAINNLSINSVAGENTLKISSHQQSTAQNAPKKKETLQVLQKPFAQSELATPDFEVGWENNTLC